MNFKALLLISASLIAFSTLAFESVDTTNYHPKWIKIADLSEPQVLTIAKFAVRKHDARAGTHLQLLEVVSGYKQFNEGIYYRLILRVADLLDPNNTVTNYVTLALARGTRMGNALIYFRKANE